MITDAVTGAHLRVEGVDVGYGATTVVSDASFVAEPGTVTGLIGPNGGGKSTLLRAVAGLHRASRGSVWVDDVDLRSIPVRRAARLLAMLPQTAVAPEGLTVADLVARGRQPYQAWYRQWTDDDEQIVRDAMERMDVLALAERPLDELSGGQRQRAWIALCLAQATPVLLLDEPTTHLDISHTVEILATVRRLAHDDGRTVLMVLHDLSFAARYCDRLIVLADGRLQPPGTPQEVLTPDCLRTWFDVEARVYPDPLDGVPTIAPLEHA